MWRNLQSNAPHCRNEDQAKLRMENRIAQERKEGQERRPVIKYVSAANILMFEDNASKEEGTRVA